MVFFPAVKTKRVRHLDVIFSLYFSVLGILCDEWKKRTETRFYLETTRRRAPSPRKALWAYIFTLYASKMAGGPNSYGEFIQHFKVIDCGVFSKNHNFCENKVLFLGMIYIFLNDYRIQFELQLFLSKHLPSLKNARNLRTFLV